MPLDKLLKLEKALSLFRARYDEVETERNSLIEEIRALKEANSGLMNERASIKKKVESLISEIEDLDIWS